MIVAENWVWRSSWLLAAGLAFCSVGCAREPAGGPALPPVVSGETYLVKSEQVTELKPVAAIVTTRDLGQARARISGTLVRLTVKEGDQVRAGQVLALVADERLDSQIQAFEAQATAAAAEAKRSQADLVRVRALYDKGYYARAGLDQAQAQSDAAQANLEAARAQRSTTAETALQGAILAPASGRVLKADVPAGSVVTAGQTVVTVTAGQPVLRVEIPEAQGAGLSKGQPIEVDPQDLPDVRSATVGQIYPAVAAGRVVADLLVPGLEADLIGRRVRVRLPVGQRSALIIPRRFLATRFGIDYVRILDRDQRSSEVAVQTAPAPGPDTVEILSGLKVGDTLAVPGVQR